MNKPRGITNAPHAWTFLALGRSRQFAGNTGYDDRLNYYYSYDSTVPNHARVRAGDLAVLRNSECALGMGWINRIDETPDEKIRRRCPFCRTTALKTRAQREPRYRCDAGHEFEVPLEETLAVVHFRAHYADSWRQLTGLLKAAALAPLYVAAAQQHAIRALDIDRFAAVVTTLSLRLPIGWWDGLT